MTGHAAIATRRCPVDGTPIASWRSARPPADAVLVRRLRDTTYCSPRCRQKASRRRRGLPSGWGDAHDRSDRRARARAVVPVTGQEATP